MLSVIKNETTKVFANKVFWLLAALGALLTLTPGLLALAIPKAYAWDYAYSLFNIILQSFSLALIVYLNGKLLAQEIATGGFRLLLERYKKTWKLVFGKLITIIYLILAYQLLLFFLYIGTTYLCLSTPDNTSNYILDSFLLTAFRHSQTESILLNTIFLNVPFCFFLSTFCTTELFASLFLLSITSFPYMVKMREAYWLMENEWLAMILYYTPLETIRHFYYLLVLDGAQLAGLYPHFLPSFTWSSILTVIYFLGFIFIPLWYLKKEKV
jgi:hypothetical protein